MRLLALLLTTALGAAEPLAIATSIPDLADLTRQVGGDAVRVTCLADGAEDPHQVEPRPSMVTTLAKAEVLVEVGLDYDTHWLDEALAGAQRTDLIRLKVCDAVTLIKPPPEDDGHGHSHGHSHGGTHAAGNPHFLCDPVAGAQVLLGLGRALGQVRPTEAEAFRTRAEDAALALGRALVGEAAVTRVGRSATLLALAAGDPTPLVGPDLAGWLGRLRPLARTALVADHDGWPYLARRFDLALVAFLEPEPGVPTSTAQLARVVSLAKGAQARGLLLGPWSDERQAQPIANAIGVPLVLLAPQVGARPGATTYAGTIEANVTALEALVR